MSASPAYGMSYVIFAHVTFAAASWARRGSFSVRPFVRGDATSASDVRYSLVGVDANGLRDMLMVDSTNAVEEVKAKLIEARLAGEDGAL